VTYNAEVPLEFSEIDPVQNNGVNLAVNTVGFSETQVWSAAATGPLTGVNIIYGGSGYNKPRGRNGADRGRQWFGGHCYGHGRGGRRNHGCDADKRGLGLLRHCPG
jgi:hypothetical protein